MPIPITCTECNKKLSAPDTAVGKKIRCPACKAVIPVPAPEVFEEPEKFEEPDEDATISETASPKKKTRNDDFEEPDEDSTFTELEPAPRRKSRPSEEITEEEPKGYGLDEKDGDERDRRREKRRKRYDDDDDVDDNFGDMRPRRRAEPHRGGVILTLGILSILFALLCPLICFILASIANNMANTDMPKMERGHMDRSGEGSTSAGRVCAWVGTILGLINCVAGVALQTTGVVKF